MNIIQWICYLSKAVNRMHMSAINRNNLILQYVVRNMEIIFSFQISSMHITDRDNDKMTKSKHGGIV